MSEGVDTLSAILAGGTFATDCLFMVLAPVCDAILVEHPVELSLYIDDLAIRAISAECYFRLITTGVVSHVVEALEEDLLLKVSRCKTPWLLDEKTKTVVVVPAECSRPRSSPLPRVELVGDKKAAASPMGCTP